MKITFLSPAPNLSGGQRVIAIYADKLMARGHDVTVLARNYQTPTFGAKLRHLARGQKLPSPPKATHFDRMQAPLVIPSHCGPLTSHDVPDADILIATWWETAFEAVHFPPSKGHKFYFVQHHEVHPHLPMHISAASYYLPLKKIVIASWLVDVMRDLYGDSNVALVPNGVDQNLFFAPKRGKQAAPTIGLMYSGKRFKGVDIALSAVEIARQSHPNLRVVAFGTRRPSRDLPLPSGVEFHLSPRQDAIRDIYAACDVFISASRSEGFGLPILEAMACRTPVIATRTGCADDVISDGQNGFTVDIDDVESLGFRLSEVFSMDNRSWETMSDAAYMTALRHNWDESSVLFENALIGG